MCMYVCIRIVGVFRYEVPEWFFKRINEVNVSPTSLEVREEEVANGEVKQESMELIAPMELEG